MHKPYQEDSKTLKQKKKSKQREPLYLAKVNKLAPGISLAIFQDHHLERPHAEDEEEPKAAAPSWKVPLVGTAGSRAVSSRVLPLFWPQLPCCFRKDGLGDHGG